MKHSLSFIVLEEILNSLNLRAYLRDLQIETDDDKETVHIFFSPKAEGQLMSFINEVKKLNGIEKVEFYE